VNCIYGEYCSFLFFSIATLLWQLFVLFVCCSGIGLIFLTLLPEQFSPLSKTVLCGTAGFFAVVLLAQNLFYLGIPIRISAWLTLGIALVQFWRYRGGLTRWITLFCSNPDTRTVVFVVLSTVLFHAVVPARQGLEWFTGKDTSINSTTSSWPNS
jgi:hypothetical protein